LIAECFNPNNAEHRTRNMERVTSNFSNPKLFKLETRNTLLPTKNYRLPTSYNFPAPGILHFHRLPCKPHIPEFNSHVEQYSNLVGDFIYFCWMHLYGHRLLGQDGLRGLPFSGQYSTVAVQVKHQGFILIHYWIMRHIRDGIQYHDQAEEWKLLYVLQVYFRIDAGYRYNSLQHVAVQLPLWCNTQYRAERKITVEIKSFQCLFMGSQLQVTTPFFGSSIQLH